MVKEDPEELLASEWALAKDELATRNRALRKADGELQNDSISDSEKERLRVLRERLELAVNRANSRLQYLSERRQKTQEIVQHIVVTGGDTVINSVSGSGSQTNTLGESTDQRTQRVSLAEKQQDFHFNFLNRSLTQSNIMFWVSVVFMISGGAIVLACIALLAFRDGQSGVKWASGTVGAVFTAAGGILNRQARRKDEHITNEAKGVADKIDSNDRFEKATSLIERVADPDLKDRLKATAAMEQLGFNPDPDTMAQLLIPPHAERPTRELSATQESAEGFDNPM
ncbi:hypothetical protein [Streptomyces sp. NPDC020917]|uniref:TRADD-N-associated membrane domain-containing protein n=1 Tax=Streptomyces sp. NPDC020917 TaxID=3365102 RepID=UPI0037ADD146